jgi:hypothetical protein
MKDNKAFVHSKNSAFKPYGIEKPRHYLVSYNNLIEMIYDNSEILEKYNENLLTFVGRLKVELVNNKLKLVYY